jgi:hypothetical protein
MKKITGVVASSVVLVALYAGASCESEAPPLSLSASSSSTGGSDAGTGGAAEGVVSQSSASDFETDPQIAAAEGGFLAIVWMGGRGTDATHIGYTLSADSGASWSEPAQIVSPDGDSLSRPDVTNDRFGNFYLTYLSHRRGSEGGKVYVAKAATGATSFGAPVVVSEPDTHGIYDTPRISRTRTGMFLVAYTQIINGISSLVSATSKDAEEWTRVFVAPDDDRHRVMPYPCAARVAGSTPGRTWIAHLREARLLVRWSDDDGVTWPGENAVDDDVQGRVAHPPTCVAQGDEIWITYGISNDGQAKPSRPRRLVAIRTAYSSDGGENFELHAPVHDPEAAAYFGIPQTAIEDSDAVNLIYYTGQGFNDGVGTFRRARWTLAALAAQADAGVPDGGELGLSSALVQSPITFAASRESRKWVGDHVGLVFQEGKIYGSFVDNSDGYSHIRFSPLNNK